MPDVARNRGGDLGVLMMATDGEGTGLEGGGGRGVLSERSIVRASRQPVYTLPIEKALGNFGSRAKKELVSCIFLQYEHFCWLIVLVGGPGWAIL